MPQVSLVGGAVLAVVLTLGACARVPDPVVTPPGFLGPPLPAPGYGAPIAQEPADVTPGFNDKEPDTCKAADLQGLLGQPAGNLRTIALEGPVRIIRPGELVTQEYDSHRIDVDVDGAGNMWRIQCG